MSVRYDKRHAANGIFYPRDLLTNALQSAINNKPTGLVISALDPADYGIVDLMHVIGICDGFSWNKKWKNNKITLNVKCKYDLSNMPLFPCGIGKTDRTKTIGKDFKIICLTIAKNP